MRTQGKTSSHLRLWVSKDFRGQTKSRAKLPTCRLQPRSDVFAATDGSSAEKLCCDDQDLGEQTKVPKRYLLLELPDCICYQLEATQICRTEIYRTRVGHASKEYCFLISYGLPVLGISCVVGMRLNSESNITRPMGCHITELFCCCFPQGPMQETSDFSCDQIQPR